MKDNLRKIIKWCFIIMIVGIGCTIGIIVKFKEDICFGEILSFIGSILGSIIGGLVTFIGLKYTIKTQREEERKNRSLQTMPHLRFSVKDTDKKVFSYEEVSSCNYSFGYNSGEKSNKLYRNISVIQIENIGVNAAADIYINLEVNDKLEYKIAKQNNSFVPYTLATKEKINLKVAIRVADIIECRGGCRTWGIKMTLIYRTIIDEYYRQEVFWGVNLEKSEIYGDNVGMSIKGYTTSKPSTLKEAEALLNNIISSCNSSLEYF